MKEVLMAVVALAVGIAVAGGLAWKLKKSCVP
jgi:hypothetical protein